MKLLIIADKNVIFLTYYINRIMGRYYTLAQVKKHNNKGSCWVVIHGNVYDLTKFLKEHPGGQEGILEKAGTDATHAFDVVGHSKHATEMLEKFKVGMLFASELNIHSQKPRK